MGTYAVLLPLQKTFVLNSPPSAPSFANILSVNLILPVVSILNYSFFLTASKAELQALSIDFSSKKYQMLYVFVYMLHYTRHISTVNI